MKLNNKILVTAFILLSINSMASEFCVIMNSSGPEGSYYFYKGICTNGKEFKSESISGLNPFYHETRMKAVLSKLISKTASEGYVVLADLSGTVSQSGQQFFVIAKGIESNSQICVTRGLQLESCTKNVTSLPFSYDLSKSKTVDANSVLVANGFKKTGEAKLGFFGQVFFEK